MTIVALVVALSCKVLAADYMTLAIKSVEASDDTLRMLVSADVPDPEADVEMSVSIDGTPAELKSVTNVGESGIGVTYLILTDVSGSMSAANKEEIASVVGTIADALQGEDNAAISFMGTQIVSSKFTKDADALKQTIADVSDWNQYSNIYNSIYNGLRVLEDSADVRPEKCLVVITDGEENDATGITKEETVKKIEEAGITICTVAVSMAPGDTYMQEMAKELGGFARSTPGGLHQVIGQSGLTAEEAASNVVRHMNETIVIEADLTGYTTEAAESVISFEAVSAEYGRTSANRTVPSEMLLRAVTPPEPEEEAEAEPEETEEPAPEEEPAGQNTLPVILIVAGLVLAAAAAVLFLKARKTKDDEEPAQNMVSAPDLPGTHMPQQEEAPAQPQAKKIRMAKVGLNETEVREVSVRGELVIGRSADKAGFVIDDSRVSSAHCKLTFDGEKLSVTDLDSTNGTLVNGIRISQRCPLFDQDVITVGGMEWRIIF